jgi:hypothetical protein
VKGPFFLFSGDTMGVRSRFQVLRAQTRFWRYGGRRVPFSCYVRARTHFRRDRGASGPVFKFYTLGLIFGGTDDVPSRFQVFRSRACFRWYRGLRVSFSCFALSVSISTVPGVSCPVFLLCVPRLDFGGTEGFGSRFHVLRARTSFRRYRGLGVPFSCFALPESFSAVPRASGPVFMFCAPRIVFGGTGGVGSRFPVFCYRTCFRLYRGRWVPFSCFTCPD